MKRRSVMTKVRLGDRVQVQYRGSCKDGTIIGHREGPRVLKFTAGSNEVIPGVSFGVVGMALGEEKRLTLEASQAYGSPRAKLIKEIPRQRFPKHVKLHVGKRLVSIGAISGRRRRVRVVAVRPATVIVDGNHPLAGKVLEVNLQLLSLDPLSAGRRRA